MSIVNSIIYTICLLFCYNILIVSVVSIFNLGGNLVSYSLVNYLGGTLLNLVSFKRKKMQKYFFNKKELVGSLVVLLVVLLVSLIRFRGFIVLSYETGDPAVHYKHALLFKDNLEILNENNSEDLIYGDFGGVMPISYVNCGFLMKVMENIATYKVFILFDVFCLIMSSLLFFITVQNILVKGKKFYAVMLTLIYLLGFPLNNMIFGFCYLGLGVMVVNLIFLTVFKIDDYKKDKVIKLILLFMLSFSMFFSYYLFMPFVYLNLGIYYIYLWRKKKMTLKELFGYGIITLLIPFGMGLVKFILPGFMSGGDASVVSAISTDGYIYDNDSAGYFFVIMSVIFLIRSIKKRKELTKFDFWSGSILGYVLLFYVLRMLDLVSSYYFYKLFYLYWFFAIMFIGKLLMTRRYYLYTVFCLILVGISIVCVVPDSSFARFLVKGNIFCWNVNTFLEEKITFTKNELELIDESIKYGNECVENGVFLISGHRFKNSWYYSMTGNIPLYGYQYDKPSQLGSYNITFNFWEGLDDYKCLIYFYEDEEPGLTSSNLEVLFSNEEGAILKKKG